MKKIANHIALVGRNGSGKSLISEYLHTKGFKSLSLSTILRQYAQKEAVGTDREALIHFGAEIKAKHGSAVLAQEAFKAVLECPDQKKWVFDSIRLPAELVYLKQQGFFVLGVDAPLALRYQRIKNRGHDTDSVDFDTFKLQDELEFLGKGSGQHIQACFEECDMILNNDSELSALTKELDLLC